MFLPDDITHTPWFASLCLQHGLQEDTFWNMDAFYKYKTQTKNQESTSKIPTADWNSRLEQLASDNVIICNVLSIFIRWVTDFPLNSHPYSTSSTQLHNTQ